ncbi:hypothetical protein GCM10010266_03830 [Streptomyces griseomycini]|nr:hypothetical protein GCM10010266_03830 [Streptomyces griseomycini]GGR01770.1 hypothetical protein GCM10015536_03130 [Streptomyces griseomycini]
MWASPPRGPLPRQNPASDGSGPAAPAAKQVGAKAPPGARTRSSSARRLIRRCGGGWWRRPEPWTGSYGPVSSAAVGAKASPQWKRAPRAAGYGALRPGPRPG